VSTGRITAIRADKGFGFIKDGPDASNSNDIIFHRSAVVGVDFEDLREGQEVSYRTEPDPRDASRFRAADVRVVSAESN
jgi:CspA family cold shock protein